MTSMRLEDASTIEQVKQRLLEMFEADQHDRDNLEADIARSEELKNWVQENGWPSRKVYGDETVMHAWMIVQHATFDLPFMLEVKAMMDQTFWPYAYLEDRTLRMQGKLQRFATQGVPFDPSTCERGYNRRRWKIGLPARRLDAA